MSRLSLILLLAAVACPAKVMGQEQTGTDRLAPLYAGGAAKIPSDKPARLDVSGDEVLTVRYKGGSWSLSYTRIRTLYVSLSRPPAVGELAGATYGLSLLGLLSKRRSFLSIRYEDAEGVSRNIYFYVPPGGGGILDTLAQKAHLSAVFESYEARRAILETPRK